jgi:ERCC4-related helicase
MDYLRENLQQLYGSQVACYSGRGGELCQAGRTSHGAEATSAPLSSEWQTVPKEQIKRQFREGDIKILLCTESASEGLNL